MTTVKLHRVISGSEGTFGVITFKGQPLCVTCENPWFDNQKNVSCIPAGNYECSSYSGTKHRNIWKLHDVPDRTAIIFHAGNTINDTKGCILPGKNFGIINRMPAVMSSRQAIEMLRRILPKEFDLIITWP